MGQLIAPSPPGKLSWMSDSLLELGENLWFLLLDRKCSPWGHCSNSPQANSALLVLAELLGGFKGWAGAWPGSFLTDVEFLNSEGDNRNHRPNKTDCSKVYCGVELAPTWLFAGSGSGSGLSDTAFSLQIPFPREWGLKECSFCVAQTTLVALSVTLGWSMLLGGLSWVLRRTDHFFFLCKSVFASALSWGRAEVTSQMVCAPGCLNLAVREKRGVGKTLRLFRSPPCSSEGSVLSLAIVFLSYSD